MTSGQVASLYKAGPETVAGPALKILRSGNQVTLQWPANATGFTLESASNLLTGTWSSVPGNITVSNGFNNLTVNIDQTPAFFRLKQ